VAGDPCGLRRRITPANEAASPLNAGTAQATKKASRKRLAVAV